jgi:hypothetical protein
VRFERACPAVRLGSGEVIDSWISYGSVRLGEIGLQLPQKGHKICNASLLRTSQMSRS